MRLIDADALKDELLKQGTTYICLLIDNAPTVNPQKIVTIPHELIEKLVLCVVDIVENIDWDKAIEAYKERPTGKWEEPFEMNGKSYHKCTNCHISTELILIDKYCPNCGADMRGDSHGQ